MNLRPLLCKPAFAWTINKTLQFDHFAHDAIRTNSERIATATQPPKPEAPVRCRQAKHEDVPRRDSRCASGYDGV